MNANSSADLEVQKTKPRHNSTKTPLQIQLTLAHTKLQGLQNWTDSQNSSPVIKKTLNMNQGEESILNELN